MLPEIEIYSLHYHNVCEVGLCRCGSGLWLVGDSVTAIHGGDVMIVPPGIHHYSRTVGDPCMCEFIYFDEERLLSVCCLDKGLKKRLPKNLPSVIRDEKARSLLRSMIETRDVTESALWYALFLKWLPDDMELPETRDDTELSPAMRRIMLSYSEPLTMADLAAECGFCPSWFAKRLQTGVRHVADGIPERFQDEGRGTAAARPDLRPSPRSRRCPASVPCPTFTGISRKSTASPRRSSDG